MTSDLTGLLAKMTVPQIKELHKAVDAFNATEGSFDWPNGMSVRLRTGKNLEALGLVKNVRSSANRYDHWVPTVKGVRAAAVIPRLERHCSR